MALAEELSFLTCHGFFNCRLLSLFSNPSSYFQKINLSSPVFGLVSFILNVKSVYRILKYNAFGRIVLEMFSEYLSIALKVILVVNQLMTFQAQRKSIRKSQYITLQGKFCFVVN